ncbi:MAG: 30S ribosomal protein S20 [Candidatus Omnitrophica bacterium]|nr:30S ribosomal protein S20 [Candidatus Omnitrophota bacterium]
MPQRKAGIKDLRKSHTRKMNNLDQKTVIKKTEKSFLKAVQEKKLDEAKETLKILHKKIDKAAKTNILKDNTASRRKSRFSKLLKSIA